MQHYLLICKSLTYAQRSQHLLERSGISATVGKAPKSAYPEGCGYGINVSEKNFEPALKALADAGLSPKRILIVSQDGSASEVDT